MSGGLGRREKEPKTGRPLWPVGPAWSGPERPWTEAFPPTSRSACPDFLLLVRAEQIAPFRRTLSQVTTTNYWHNLKINYWMSPKTLERDSRYLGEGNSSDGLFSFCFLQFFVSKQVPVQATLGKEHLDRNRHSYKLEEWEDTFWGDRTREETHRDLCVKFCV